MFSRNLFSLFLSSQHRKTCPSHVRNIQMSLIGAANEIGSYLALLLKQNNKIKKLQLYDDDAKVQGVGLELSHLPGGPCVSAWTGDASLKSAIRDSKVIVMVYRVPRKPGDTREKMIAANAPAVQKLCFAMANENPGAFLAIVTNPINSIVPFASALMYKYGCYNPFKIFGITQIDVTRTRMVTANALHLNPSELSLPVLGGHSEETIIPLFSNMQPATMAVEPCKADSLTRVVRKAGIEVVFQKQGSESATLAMAMSIYECLDLIADALGGKDVIVNCYTANPNFGTRFFSGPTKVGPYGIIKACHGFQLNDFESCLLNASVPLINRDVELGEGYVRFLDVISKY